MSESDHETLEGLRNPETAEERLQRLRKEELQEFHGELSAERQHQARLRYLHQRRLEREAQQKDDQ